MLENMVVLGFDVGSKKTGVAVGQTFTHSARALQQLACHNGIPLDMGQIKALVATWRPHALIVGIPKKPDGTEQFATQCAYAFIAMLRDHVDLPIHQIDELLTTKSARSDLFERGGYRQLQKSDIDSYAAKLIVESWLNERLGLDH